MCLVSFVPGLLFHACFVFRPFLFTGVALHFSFIFCPVCFAVRYAIWLSCILFAAVSGCFLLPPCAGSFMLWYLPVFMLLCLCICYCFCFALATFVGRFFFATFFVLASFLYNLVLFVHFLAIRLSCWVFACLYVLAFRFRHRTRVCLHYHCVAFCVNR